MRRTYWRFYWPLAVGGTTVVLANQFENGALARYPDASREIAIFAYAFSAFAFFRASLVFMPQMANLLARSRASQRVCLAFAVSAGTALTVPLLFLGNTSAGGSLVSRIFDIAGAELEDVLTYVRWLAPLVLIQSLRQYATGLLIQHESTRLVTTLNVVHVTTTLAALVTGYHLKLPAVVAVVGAQWLAALVHLTLSAAALWRTYRTPDDGPPQDYVGAAAVFRFFWPVALTSTMFAASRPVLYAFVGRGPDAEVRVAALRVAFDLALFFHQPLNQFRNLFATFGIDDLAGIRRFQIEVVLAMSGAMAFLSYTSIDTFVFSKLLGVRGDTLRFAEDALRVMCWLPLVVGFRNYFHGIALARLTTVSMAVGAVIRVGAITVAAFVAAASVGLEPSTAAMILVLGFFVEALVVLVLVRNVPR